MGVGGAGDAAAVDVDGEILGLGYILDLRGKKWLGARETSSDDWISRTGDDEKIESLWTRVGA